MTLTELLQECNVPVAPEGHHHRTPGFIQTDCPLCSPGSGRFRLGITPLVATCWACGKLDWADTLSVLTGKTPYELKEIFRDYRHWGRELPAEKPGGTLLPPAGLGGLLRCHVEYLRQRGFNPEEIVRVWGIGGIGLAARLAWRLWLPVTREGRQVSWTTRATTDNLKRRYVNARPEEEAVPIKHCLYGEDLVRGHAVVVVEGPLDAWAVGPGAVSTFGVVVTGEQVARLQRFPVRYICFDAEGVGEKSAKDLQKRLGGNTRIISLEHGKDPADCLGSEEGKKELGEIRKILS